MLFIFCMHAYATTTIIIIIIIVIVIMVVLSAACSCACLPMRCGFAALLLLTRTDGQSLSEQPPGCMTTEQVKHET